jgi:hypothetical protein
MATPRLIVRLYKPGELAPVTGIYRVIHGRGHRPEHTAIVLRGEVLPPCRTCGVDVSFRVDRQSSHITHDMDFAGPTSLIVAKGS